MPLHAMTGLLFLATAVLPAAASPCNGLYGAEALTCVWKEDADFMSYFRWTPHPVIVTIGDNRDYIGSPLIFLMYHYYKVGGPPKSYYSY